MAVSQLTFLAPQPGTSYQTRSGTFTADGFGFIGNVPLTGSAVADLVASGCIPCATSSSSNFRNILDGGDFTVNPWQRNIPGLASSNHLAAALTATTPTYLADRWFGSSTGSTSLQMTQTADVTIPGFSRSTFVSRSTGSGVSPLLFGQVVDPWDVIKLQGQQVTFSFWARAGATFSAAGGLLSVSMPWGTDTYANSTAANMIAGSWAGQANIPLTPNVVALTSSMTRYSFTGVVPYGALNLGVLLSFTPVGTASGATDGYYVSGLQLELGGLSPFEHRDIQVETEICQRYAWVIQEPAAGVIVGAGQCGTTTNATIYMATPVQMATAPTVTCIYGSFAVLHVVTATACSALAAIGTHSPNALSISATVASGLTAGQGAMLQGGTGAGYIVASADY